MLGSYAEVTAAKDMYVRARTGWLGALQDPQVGHAISLIHADPARAWSVASLADELRQGD